MDLRDWPDSALASLEWMLNELSIPYAWNPAGMLLVPTNHSKEVNDLITELEAVRSPHGTLPQLRLTSISSPQAHRAMAHSPSGTPARTRVKEGPRDGAPQSTRSCRALL
jgi:hypothetical protein